MRLQPFLVNALSRSIIANALYMLYRYLYVVLVRGLKVSSADKLVRGQRRPKLAVIGCGPSINQLDADFFDKLEDYDIAAFSHAALLPTRIDYYMYEIPEGELLKQHEALLYPALKQKQEAGLLHGLTLKNPHSKSSSFQALFPSCINTMTFPIHLKSAKKIKQFIKLISAFGLAKKYFFQSRASLFATCYWADALGYEEILLIGIDLNSPQYFYEEKNHWLTQTIPNPFSEEELQDVKAHPTNDSATGLKVETALALLKESMQAEVFINNPNSALASVFKYKEKP